MTAVFDASVVVRWYVDDVLSLDALSMRADLGAAIAPMLLTAEVANAFRRYVVHGAMPVETATENLKTVSSIVTLVDHQPLLQPAFDLACDRNHSVHDCLYIALARRQKIPLATADAKLARKFQDLPGLELRAIKRRN